MTVTLVGPRPSKDHPGNPAPRGGILGVGAGRRGTWREAVGCIDRPIVGTPPQFIMSRSRKRAASWSPRLSRRRAGEPPGWTAVKPARRRRSPLDWRDFLPSPEGVHTVDNRPATPMALVS
jgi:hypothetical protein